MNGTSFEGFMTREVNERLLREARSSRLVRELRAQRARRSAVRRFLISLAGTAG